MKHLGLSQSMERWSAPQLEHGYAILGPGDGAPDVGVAARTSLGIYMLGMVEGSLTVEAHG